MNSRNHMKRQKSAAYDKNYHKFKDHCHYTGK